MPGLVDGGRSSRGRFSAQGRTNEAARKGSGAETFCGGVPVVLGGRWPLRRYARGVKQDLGGHADRYEAANRDEHANLGAKRAKRGPAVASLRGEVGKLNALRGREVLDGLHERWFPEADQPPDESRRTVSSQSADAGSGATKGTGLRKTVEGQVFRRAGRPARRALLRFRGGPACSGIAAG